MAFSGRKLATKLSWVALAGGLAKLLRGQRLKVYWPIGIPPTGGSRDGSTVTWTLAPSIFTLLADSGVATPLTRSRTEALMPLSWVTETTTTASKVTLGRWKKGETALAL